MEGEVSTRNVVDEGITSNTYSRSGSHQFLGDFPDSNKIFEARGGSCPVMEVSFWDELLAAGGNLLGPRFPVVLHRLLLHLLPFLNKGGKNTTNSEAGETYLGGVPFTVFIDFISDIFFA